MGSRRSRVSPLLQVCRPYPGEGSDRGLGSAIHRIRRESLASHNRSSQNNCPAIRNKRRCLLNAEERTLHIAAKHSVKLRFTNLAERSVLRRARIRKFSS
jgi:hypothetical protein